MKRVLSILAPLTLVFAGCSEDNPAGPGGGGYVEATSPINAVRRALATYAGQDRISYGATLTSDFGFLFSPEADSAFADEFGTDWNAADEDAAAHHLFDGFTSSHDLEFHEGVKRIVTDFVAASVLDDPDHPDSTAHYRLVRVPLLGMIVTFDDNHQFAFTLPYDFYVVRGDAAFLPASLPADSTLWYVRKIDDQSPAPIAAPSGGPSTLHDEELVTWGSLRGVYRD